MDFTKVDYTAIPAAMEKAQKEIFDQTEKNIKAMSKIFEQNLAFWRAVVNNANEQTAKFTKSFTL